MPKPETICRRYPTVEPTLASLLQRQSRRIAAGDVQAAAAIASVLPHELRLYTETEVLGGWAAETLAKDAAAEAHLRFARTVGLALAARGDRLLHDVVQAIESANPRDRAILAAAHASYTRGRGMKQQPSEAEARFADAEQRFREAKSPMAQSARYYRAVAIFDQKRHATARQELEAALSEAPPAYRSLRGHLLWQLGLVHGEDAHWGAAIGVLNDSIAQFESAGEPYQAAVVRQILSEVYDAIGDSQTAWKQRVLELAVLGRTTTHRTQTAISAISYAAGQRKQWRVARSFLDLEIDVTEEVPDPPSHADALLRRAVANHFLQRPDAALRDFREDARVISSMPDKALREAAQADRLSVQALLAATPAQAIADLTTAIDFHAHGGVRLYLPSFYLARSRAFRSVGDHTAARLDLQNGIAELESTRETLGDTAARMGIFDASEELFLEAIADALDRHQPAEALDVAERAKARTLLDTIAPNAGTPRFSTAAIPASTAIVEYVFLQDRLIILVADRSGVQAVAVPASPDSVEAQAAAYRDALEHRRDADIRPMARTLGRLLVDPIAALIAGHDDVVLVPDRRLASIPFASLIRRDGHYLVEDYRLVTDPSALVYVRTATCLPPSRPPAGALVLVAPAPEGNDVLPNAQAEAESIARLYPHAKLIPGNAGTLLTFLREAPLADVIHFSGHGVSVADGGKSTSLLLSGKGASIDAATVEHLHLTHVSVVILAACNTARGETRWTEGTLSMARAFFAAGSPNVVATLWSVDDRESARFFRRLHQHLIEGLPCAEALRRTQIEWLQWSQDSPSAWASAQVYGR